MRQFEIKIHSKIGSLADVCEAISNIGVGIRAIATEEKGKHGIVKMITEHEDLTREALNMAGFDFNEYEVIPAKVLDKPGELAKLSRALSSININIQSIFLLNRDKGVAEIAFKVDNLSEARRILEE